jgi:anti-sigma B factor antagonist
VKAHIYPNYALSAHDKVVNNRLFVGRKAKEIIMALFGKKEKKTVSNMSSKSHLDIEVNKSGAEYTFVLNGRLDTITSPDLDAKVNEVTPDAEKLIFDLTNLEYISSAGLRVLLGATQAMEDKGEMVVRNLTESVKEVFELTGFSRLFAIE